MLIDAHLDLAFNAWLGRDLTVGLSQLRASDPVAEQTACVCFESLRSAEVSLCFGTLFAPPAPSSDNRSDIVGGYQNPKQARQLALSQLANYQRWQEQGHIRLLTSRVAVAEHLATWQPSDPLGVLLLMEGADPISSAADLAFWVQQGVYMVGLAWGKTRYAGGTDALGPLSEAGCELVLAMQEQGVCLDASHLDDASFWQALELAPNLKVVASHSNSRALVAGNRQLSDEMAQAIAARGGIIGLVFHSRFILPAWQPEQGRATLADLAQHALHYGQLLGWQHVGLGSDLDGGFGLERCPQEIAEYGDIPRLLQHLPVEIRQDVSAGNWRRWLLQQWAK